MIRKAVIKDLSRIMRMIQAVVLKMNDQGSKQWDEHYPAESDYLRDIKRDELFVFEEMGAVFGVCSISKRGHEEYHEINWSTNAPAWTLKRIAVDPNQHGRGIADQLILFAEKLATQAGIYHLHTDTFSENQHAKKLFQRHGFRFVVARQDPNDTAELYYYEKSLREKE